MQSLGPLKDYKLLEIDIVLPVHKNTLKVIVNKELSVEDIIRVIELECNKVTKTQNLFELSICQGDIYSGLIKDFIEYKYLDMTPIYIKGKTIFFF